MQTVEGNIEKEGMARNYKPVIDLGLGLDCVGVIIEWPSGVIYANQTSGFTCNRPQLEGVFMPLEDESRVFADALLEHFTSKPYDGGGWASREERITQTTADFLDIRLGAWGIQVDRSKLSESEEAWIHVVLISNPDERFPLYSGFEKAQGVLVWCNSD